MAKLALNFDELGERFGLLERLKPSSCAIGVTGSDVAAYARALEFGSVAGERPWPHPGPRTVAAVDPETGAEVVVSAQAPQGFIRVQAPQFLDALRGGVAQPVNWLNVAEVEAHLNNAVRSAAEDALEKIRSGVPRDSGGLQQSLALLEE